jgi:L-fuconolactonase
MRIDAHQHFWKYAPTTHGWINDEMAVIRRDFLPNDLEPILSKHNIDGTVAVQADESIHETEFLLSLSEKHAFIKAVIGWIDLRSPQIHDQLAYFKKFRKLVGFRCIMQGQPDEAYLNNEIFIKNVALLKDFNYTYDLLVYHHQLPSVLKFIEKIPENRLILDHIGKPDIKAKNYSKWKENIFELAQHPGIYCKLSGMITEANYSTWKYDDIVPYMDAVGEAFGAERICFGSDWPVCLVAGNYDKMIGVVEKWASQLNQKDYNQLFGLNTSRFYNI